jgi:LysM repeat protein
MDNNHEMEDFKEEIANSMKYDFEDEDLPHRGASRGSGLQRKTLILGGVGVFVLIILMVLFFGNGDELSKNDLTFFKTRLDMLEKRLAQFEGAALKIATLEKDEQELKRSLAEADRSRRSLEEKYTALTQRLDTLQKEKAVVSAKPKKPATTQKKRPPSDKKRFHTVRSGDTLYRIANKYGLSMNKLCSLNNIRKSTIIKPGQKLVVSTGE